jgi:predicted transcriptional regulator of viral defense system
VDELPKRGKYTFSQEDVFSEFSELPRDRVRASLYRLTAKGELQSVWHGFFAIVLHEYGLRGVIPPTEYIDQLMKYLNRKYYVALLSAASVHGSSHQASQTYMVMIEGGPLRSKTQQGVRLSFFTRKELPEKYVERLVSRSGYISYSNRELTALDLVSRMSNIGGLSRAAEVLDGMAEDGLDFSGVGDDYYRLSPLSHIQRLGYLLDSILGYKEAAEALYAGAMKSGVRFKHTLLVPTTMHEAARFVIDRKWKVAANREVELD